MLIFEKFKEEHYDFGDQCDTAPDKNLNQPNLVIQTFVKFLLSVLLLSCRNHIDGLIHIDALFQFLNSITHSQIVNKSEHEVSEDSSQYTVQAMVGEIPNAPISRLGHCNQINSQRHIHKMSKKRCNNLLHDVQAEYLPRSLLLWQEFLRDEHADREDGEGALDEPPEHA